MSSILNGALSPNVIKTALDKVSDVAFNANAIPSRATVLDPLLFNQAPAESSAVVTEVFGSVGTWDAVAPEVELPAEAGRVKDTQTFSVVDYKKSLPITREFMRDNKWGLVAKNVKSAAEKGRITREQRGMDMFRLGFTTKLTNDGATIFSNTHTTVSGDTVDNLFTEALDDDALNTALIMMAEQKDQAGIIVGRSARVLLVPPALFKQACILTESTSRPGTANNDMNVYSVKYDLFVRQSPYLGAAFSGSDTAWFLIGDNHEMTRYTREGFNTDYVGPEFSANDVAYYKMRFAEVFGCTQYDGLLASTGLT